MRASNPLQLVMMTPKSLLRHPLARSHLADLAPGSHFKRLIPETSANIWTSPGVPNPSVMRLVLCSGKVYYDLFEAREKLSEHGVAIARVEQLSPFPYDLVQQHADVSSIMIVYCFRGCLDFLPTLNKCCDNRCRTSPTLRWCGARKNPRTWVLGAMCARASRRHSALPATTLARPLGRSRHAPTALCRHV